MKRIRTLTTLLFAALFATVLFSVPAAAKENVVPQDVVIPMPVIGEELVGSANYIPLTGDAIPEGAESASLFFFKLKSNQVERDGTDTYKSFERGKVYEAWLQIAYKKSEFYSPSTDGWGVVLKDNKSEYFYGVDEAKTTVSISEQGDANWLVMISAKGIWPALTVQDITLEYGGDWDLEPGDLPNFDIKVPETDQGLYDMPGEDDKYFHYHPYWEKGEAVYTKKSAEPLELSDKYWMFVHVVPSSYLPVVLRQPATCNTPSGDFQLYEPIKDTKTVGGDRVFRIAFKVRVNYKVKSLNITGIKEPKAGEMPKTDGITLTTPFDSSDGSLKVRVTDPANVKWRGNFNADGSFKEGETYIFELPYTILFEPSINDFNSEKGFEKVSAGSGTLVSDSTLSGVFHAGDFLKDERIMTISFKAPREKFNVAFDANGGTGSMESAVVKAGSTYTLPGCSFTGPAGKIFKKWDKGEVGKTITVDQDMILKAVWGDPALMDVVDMGDDGTYQITNVPDASGKNGVVEYQKPAFAAGSMSEKEATVPDVIVIFNITYKVESVADNAFAGNTKLKKVVIGKNVKKIGKNAYAGCTNLQTVICKSKILTKIGEGAFKGDKKLKSMSFAGTKLKAKNVGKDAIKGTNKKLVIKAPAKVVKSYKSLFKKKGNKKVKVKKLK